MLRALAALAALAALPAGAQWEPLDPAEAIPEAPAPARADPAPPAPSTVPVVVSLVGGYWGLKSAPGRGFRTSPGLGVRAEVDLVDWLPVELWVLAGRHQGGTPVVASTTQYLAALVTVGWQYAQGPGLYGVNLGLSATFHRVRHDVNDSGAQSISGGGVRFGPAWTLVMKWRISVIELRFDLGSQWRDRQADLLALAGVGWVF